MTETEFVYVTYIAATPRRVWDALLEPEFTREYWGNDNVSAAVFFELETVAPAAATTFVAEWMRIADGRIRRIQSAFDGRPFAAMFGV